MSLDEKKRESFTVTLKGMKSDFEAMADVLETASKRFNLDIYPNTVEIPGSIGLTGEEVTAAQYPRGKRGLDGLIKALREEGSAVVDFGMINILAGGKQTDAVKLMNQVTIGRKFKAGEAFMREDTIGELETFLEPSGPRGGGRPSALSEMNIEWVHAESAILHEGKLTDIEPHRVADVAKVDYYPPHINKEKFGHWLKSKKYNRAYIVIMKADKMFPMDMPVYMRPGTWDSWIRTRPVAATMKMYRGKAPKTFGELLERMAVYATARSFDMTDAFLAPMTVEKGGKFSPTSGSKGKIDRKDNVFVKTKDDKGYYNFLTFLVVGRGPHKAKGLSRIEPVKSDIILPDID